jgi:hypothetical protein
MEAGINTLRPRNVQPVSPWETPTPVLLNPWKHHAGALRHAIAQAVHGGDEAGLHDLAAQLVVIGTELMDLYIGKLTPAEIAARVLDALQTDNRLSLDAYRAWLQANGGYGVLTFEDASRWVLRLGDEADRYVHVHPARWAPQTLRVRANVLKTAVLVRAYVGVHGGDSLKLALLNDVRSRFLGLSPLGKLAAGDQGIAAVLDVLRSPSP